MRYADGDPLVVVVGERGMSVPFRLREKSADGSATASGSGDGYHGHKCARLR